MTHCSSIGDRAFAVAGARLWNSLPGSVPIRRNANPNPNPKP